jgi:hypothetical protein
MNNCCEDVCENSGGAHVDHTCEPL